MRNTALLIDTNVILDWILKREPFHANAEKIIELCINDEVQGHLACHTILNLFYILRKERTATQRREILIMLCNAFNIIGIDHRMLVKVLCSDNLKDIEDDVQIQCAIEQRLDYIITRDAKDFKDSKVKAMPPEDFLAIRRAYTLK